MPENSHTKSIIISDTSCLSALTDINELDILRQLYKEVVITPEIAEEYKHSLPEWIKIKAVRNLKTITTIENEAPRLHKGESSAIALALETANSVLILDDDAARKYARKKSLTFTGTLAVIFIACDKGYIESYEKTCQELVKVNFRFTKSLQEKVKSSGTQL